VALTAVVADVVENDVALSVLAVPAVIAVDPALKIDSEVAFGVVLRAVTVTVQVTVGTSAAKEPPASFF
jgi:hypothetical protein